MRLVLGEEFGRIGGVAAVHPELFRQEAVPVPAQPSIYGAGPRRPNWVAIGLILLLHAGALLLLTAFDVIVLPHARHRPPLVVTLIPMKVAPPPPAAPKPQPKVAQPRPRPVDATPTVVPPPPAAFVVPSPPKLPTPAPVVAPVAPVAAPAPVTPPDMDAATLDNPAPVYPLESRRRHEQGTVRLRVVISPDGHVKEIGVAASSGFERLDKAALEAVRRWRFKPGTQAGVAVEAVGFLPIPFRLA
jgi:protein TonB